MPSSKLPTKPATLPMTGPRGLTTHRWCMYKPEVKCARYLACSWKRGGWACISSFSLYEFSNMGPLCTPPLRGRPWAHTDPRLTTNARKNIAAETKANPILCQVICQVFFHPEKPVVSPPNTTNEVRCPNLPARAGATLASHTLTRTAAPDTATPASVGSVKNFKCAQPTGNPTNTPRLPANPESDITLMASSRQSDG